MFLCKSCFNNLVSTLRVSAVYNEKFVTLPCYEFMTRGVVTVTGGDGMSGILSQSGNSLL